MQHNIFVKQIYFTGWLVLIQPPSFIPDSLDCIISQTGSFYLLLYSWLACPSGNILKSKSDFKCFSVFLVASSNICCIHTWADVITFPVCHHISLNSGDQHHNYHYFYDAIIMWYLEYRYVRSLTWSALWEPSFSTNSWVYLQKQTSGLKIQFLLLLFDSSLMAEELEEKADLKARMAAPPLTPQQTVLFAR